PPEILAQADKALQWTADAEVGDFIRHSHFALELTEEQKETLCSANVRFCLSDANTVHALAPFAVFSGYSFVVDLVWENKHWAYFDTRRVHGSFPKNVDGDLAAELSETIAGAAAAFDSRRAVDSKSDASDDDSYWSQFPQPDTKPSAVVDQKQSSEADDYWAMYDQPNIEHDEDANIQAAPSKVPDSAPQTASGTSRLVFESVRHALAAAATAARAVEMSEAEFLQLALAQYSQTH
ncbi:hypothetical protein H4R20_006902, partial [Coemansia guatemalensis]